MARIRTIKPSIWTDEKVRQLSRDARLLLVGLITQADDDGVFIAVPMTLAGNLFAFDDIAPSKVKKWRDEIANIGIIELYKIAGAEYGWFPKWTNHQRIDRHTPTTLPHPPSGPPPTPSKGRPNTSTSTSRSTTRSKSDSTSDSTPDRRQEGRQETGEEVLGLPDVDHMRSVTPSRADQQPPATSRPSARRSA